MYSEDDLIPISGLQHLLYCERQFALIHVEQLWSDNRFTAEGNALHERVDTVHHESRRLFRQEYAMAIRSLELGIIGKCDLVELYLQTDGAVAEAVPVEFKRGKAKEDECDRVQLCAQALCLEEMFGIDIVRGDFYYLSAHRRTQADVDLNLRVRTNGAIMKAREILKAGTTPVASYSASKCDRCSLVELCMPKSVGDGSKRVDRYVQSGIEAARRECAG